MSNLVLFYGIRNKMWQYLSGLPAIQWRSQVGQV